MKYPILLLLLLSIVFSEYSLAASNTAYSKKHPLPRHAPLHTEDFHCQCNAENTGNLLSIQLTNNGISESQAASIAKKAYGGSVIKVSRKGKVYLVRLLNNGIVRIVKVDAATGKIVGK